MNRIVIVLTFVLALNNMVCGQSQIAKAEHQNDKSVEWKTLSESNYEMKYPATWDLDKTGQMGISFAVLSQLSNEGDNFRENVNLLIQDLTGHNVDLDQFVELSENQIKTIITNGNIISSDRVKEKEAEYQKVVYTGTQGIYELKFEQLYWVIDDTAYILTLTCKEIEFNDYQELGQKILHSFEIK